MKYIVVGLGNFGSSLAIKLAEGGHEVIGVDNRDAHINQYKNKLTHVLKLDSTNELAVSQLPLSDTDGIIITIGEDSGAAITTAALFKKHAPKSRIVARYTSEIQRTIFEAMEIEEIINPEAEYANSFANKLTNIGNINTYLLDTKYEIIELKVPNSYIGKSLEEVEILNNWNVNLITIIQHTNIKNLLGKEIPKTNVLGVISNETIFEKNDTLILFGKIKALEKMMNKLAD